MTLWKAEDAPCSNTFIIHDHVHYGLYRWEPHHVTLLHSGSYSKEYFMGGAVYMCKTSEIVTTVDQIVPPHKLGLKRIKNDGTEIEVPIGDNPFILEQYEGHLLIYTQKLKSGGNLHPSLEGLRWFRKDAYTEILRYNMETNSIAKRYPHPGFGNYMLRVGDNLYLGGWGLPVQINLKNGDTRMALNLNKNVQRPPIFPDEIAVTKSGRLFFLHLPVMCRNPSRPEPFQCPHTGKSYLKANTIYEITTGEAVEVLPLKHLDVRKIIGIGDDVYAFTGGSQVAIQYNTNSKIIKEYKFPFQYLTNINYLNKSFVLCYDPTGEQGTRVNIPCVVTDDQFERNTRPFIVPTAPLGISTAYYSNGGRYAD